MSDCIFCKLANGEIPTAKLYEDDDFAVILDAGPATKGHALIIPKAHYANIHELPDELVSKAFVLAKKTATRLQNAMEADGLNIMQNNGIAAGQTVFHFHIHLIPRWTNDHAMTGWKPGALTDEMREDIISRFNNQ
jgi:histidine triad (HIT) family protein